MKHSNQVLAKLLAISGTSLLVSCSSTESTSHALSSVTPTPQPITAKSLSKDVLIARIDLAMGASQTFLTSIRSAADSLNSSGNSIRNAQNYIPYLTETESGWKLEDIASNLHLASNYADTSAASLGQAKAALVEMSSELSHVLEYLDVTEGASVSQAIKYLVDLSATLDGAGSSITSVRDKLYKFVVSARNQIGKPDATKIAINMNYPIQSLVSSQQECVAKLDAARINWNAALQSLSDAKALIKKREK